MYLFGARIISFLWAAGVAEMIEVRDHAAVVLELQVLAGDSAAVPGPDIVDQIRAEWERGG